MFPQFRCPKCGLRLILPEQRGKNKGKGALSEENLAFEIEYEITETKRSCSFGGDGVGIWRPD